VAFHVFFSSPTNIKRTGGSSYYNSFRARLTALMSSPS